MRHLYLLLVVVVGMTTATLYADVPKMINYQGVLTDLDGEPLNTTVNMEFAIYDDSLGGTPIWSELHESVVTTNGRISIVLGSMDTIRNRYCHLRHQDRRRGVWLASGRSRWLRRADHVRGGSIQ